LGLKDETIPKNEMRSFGHTAITGDC